jgi:site-specific DNA-methyltransferase (adenine-specific)
MPQTPLKENTLFYGDNLFILREYIPTESIDLIYLDPPFNSNRSYNVLFKDEGGQDSEAQITAFEDTWHWGAGAEETYHELVTEGPGRVGDMIAALRQFIGTNQMMAYLVMMAIRLVELHRVLKLTGSLYLHCDPTASHYLKIILDTIFGAQNFQNEIIWKRTGAHGGAKRWGPIHDTILFYSKTSEFHWNRVYEDYDPDYLEKFYRFSDTRGRYRLVSLTGAGTRTGDSGKPWRGVNPTTVGRHWAVPLGALREILSDAKIPQLTTQQKLDCLDQAGLIYWPAKGGVPQQKRYIEKSPGNPIQDVLSDIKPISSQAAERLGYPTQKPLALLERIVQASSNPGDIVMDPFCGCGTAIAAAEKLGRCWIGIDVTHLAISLIKYRMKDMFPDAQYKVIGEPSTVGAARQLATENRYQFQWWALSLVRARPVGGEKGGRSGKKGSDKGIDGVINFIDDASGKPKQVLIQVKSGNVRSGDIRDLRGVVDREKAAIGVFITLEPPTRDMITEAVSSGYYESTLWDRKYPCLQILTIEDLLSGKQIDMPPTYGTFKQAQRMKKQEGEQKGLGI